MKDCKTRLTNLAMGWVDNREAYGMVPHTWINVCLKIFKINEKLRIFLLRSMETWRTVSEKY